MTNNKTQQNSGEQLKNIILHGNQEQARLDCIEAIEQYKDALQARSANDTLIDALYVFFGQDRWEDNVYEYGFHATRLLEVFTKPEVNSALQKHLTATAFQQITAMLWELYNMSAILDKDSHKAAFELHELTNYSETEDKTTEQWHQLKAQYQRKLKALRVETGEEE